MIEGVAAVLTFDRQGSCGATSFLNGPTIYMNLSSKRKGKERRERLTLGTVHAYKHTFIPSYLFVALYVFNRLFGSENQ